MRLPEAPPRVAATGRQRRQLALSRLPSWLESRTAQRARGRTARSGGAVAGALWGSWIDRSTGTLVVRAGDPASTAARSRPGRTLVTG
ncbi:hypothetical protein [Pseudonocardia sp. 73-21]|uniref:hypothetical protein n=1 Tax=Pseudonocardia sp. 73-21 TaxID=1895809 RepID=UPI0026166D52|nr:hypothetical protein [Pseudonocardia sp. 73-21]